MCEASAYIYHEGQEELLLEDVDVVRPEEEGKYFLQNVFGEQKIISARLKEISLLNHRIVFQEGE